MFWVEEWEAARSSLWTQDSVVVAGVSSKRFDFISTRTHLRTREVQQAHVGRENELARFTFVVSGTTSALETPQNLAALCEPGRHRCALPAVHGWAFKGQMGEVAHITRTCPELRSELQT